MKRLEITGGFTILDDEDYDRLKGYSWHLNRGWVQRTYRRPDGTVRSVKMHREIMGRTPGDGVEVDHVNRDRTDNRRGNLRVVAHAQNAHNLSLARNNTSGYRGVSWNTQARKWQVTVGLGGRHHYFGRFADLDEVAEVARQARERLLSHAID